MCIHGLRSRSSLGHSETAVHNDRAGRAEMPIQLHRLLWRLKDEGMYGLEGAPGTVLLLGMKMAALWNLEGSRIKVCWMPLLFWALPSACLRFPPLLQLTGRSWADPSCKAGNCLITLGSF